MVKIHCLGSDPVVAFAAAELQRYGAAVAGVKPALVEADEYRASDSGRSAAGFWLGTRDRFGGVFPDPGLTHPLDDGYYIRSVPRSGQLLLAGVNPRSVLYAVYAYLESLGCRWVRPGPEGEALPEGVELRLDGYDTAEFPDYRHRGVCIEGGVSLEHAVDLVDYMVKRRFNSYFIQFQHAYIFWSRWYDRHGTPNAMAVEDAGRYTAALARHVKARGLALHMVGHGWTCESVGQPGLGWIKTEMTLPPEKQQLLALVDGERTWWRGVPIDTELCMSNPTAFQGLVHYIVDYARARPDIDLLHVWLSDGWNNRCECDGCRVKRPSDWYVDLLNELDERFAAAGLDTRIVFLAYADLLWAPETSRLRNEERFVLMFAPLTRTWRTTLLGGEPDVLQGFEDSGVQPAASGVDVQGGEADPTRAAGERPTPFRLNRNTFPTSTAVNVHYFRQWREQFAGDSFAFDYHLLWKHSIVEPTGVHIARVLHEDVRDLAKLGLNGLVNCQVQRYFFPTGLAMEVTARTLWDKTTPFEVIAAEYFAAAFGDEEGPVLWRALERLSELLDDDLLFAAAPEPKPGYESRLVKAKKELERLQVFVVSRLEERGDGASGSGASYHYLRHGLKFAEMLLPGFVALARGDGGGLAAAYRAAADYVVAHEPRLHRVLDNRMWAEWLRAYASDYDGEAAAEEPDAPASEAAGGGAGRESGGGA